MLNRILNFAKTIPLALLNSLSSGQIPQATCQFRAGGLKKRVLTVKGSGCVALGHSVTSASIWLPKEDDGSEADAALEPLRRQMFVLSHDFRLWLQRTGR
jgi:hypothetical protein